MNKKLNITLPEKIFEQSEKKIDSIFTDKLVLNKFIDEQKSYINHETLNILSRENDEYLKKLVEEKDYKKIANYIIGDVPFLKKIYMGTYNEPDSPEPRGFTTIAAVPAVLAVAAEFGLVIQVGAISDIYVAVTQKVLGRSSSLAFLTLSRIPEVKCIFQALINMSSIEFVKEISIEIFKKLNSASDINRVDISLA